MKLKSNQVAYIVHTHEPCKSALGKPITVRTAVQIDGLTCWTYDGMPLRGRYPKGAWTWHEIPDDWLRPINDVDITEEEVKRLYSPNESGSSSTKEAA